MYERENWNPGDKPWFEYHCHEGHDSTDAEVWYRSHQQATVLHESQQTDGYDIRHETTFADRCEQGMPRVYRVRFQDGLEWDVFEDELLTSRDGFTRPPPPVRPT